MNGRTNCGGSIKLHVVGGTTKPSSAAENTIWVNTSTAITKWTVTNSAPSSPSTGDVYFTTRLSTSNVLDINSPNSVYLYLGTAYQYSGSAWVEKTGEIYYSGSWHKLTTYVYDGEIGSTTGNYNSQIGGQPWSTGTAGGSIAITNYSDHFHVENSVGSGSTQWAATYKQIDFTGVNSVRFTYSRSTSGNNTGKFIVFTNKTESGTRDYPNAASSEFSNVTKGTLTINTASLSGNYWLGISTSGWNGTNYLDIYKIELL